MIMHKKLTSMIPYLAVALAAIILSGCHSGGEESSSSPKKPDQLQRHALEAEDTTKNYDDGMIIHPHIENVMGSLTYSVIDSIPENMASIDPNGQITVFSPGVLTVEVTDSSTVYKNSDDRFIITINKGINSKLSADPKHISVNSNDDFVKAENYKGKVTYSVADESLSRLNINSESGKLEPLSVGDAIVIIEDAGNEKYAAASVRVDVQIKALTPGKPQCSNFTGVPYSEGHTFSAECMSSDDVQYNYKVASSSHKDVIDIDRHSGLITALKVGKATVEVTVIYDDIYNTDPEMVYFHVNILKGKRQTVSVENQEFPYSEGQIITPDVRHEVGHPRYRVKGDSDAIEINETLGYPQIIGVGTTNLSVIDDSNSNYESSNNEFIYNITKAVHPGLKLSTEIKHSYADGLKINLDIVGQKGSLKITGDSSAVSISGETITVKRAGKIELSVKDLGNDLYFDSNTVQLVLDITPGEHPALKVTSLTTDYAQRCFPISDYVKGNKGELTVTTNLNSNVAKYNKESGCINVLKAGSTTLTVYSKVSVNYKQSKSVNLPVIVKKIDGTLTANDVTAVYDVSQALVAIPVISGIVTRPLLFEFAKGSAEDVVGLDDVGSSGQMKVLNAGTATIQVTDSGSEQQKGAVAFFNVTIEKADNLLEIKYLAEVFSANKSFLPKVDNNVKGMNMSFVLTGGYQTVELVKKSTGELKIKGAGQYSLNVTAWSRNYKKNKITFNGNVEKAPHPGIETSTVNLTYRPLKKYNLNQDIPAAIGNRVFSLSDPESILAKVDPNTGELTLLNYVGGLEKGGELVVNISEAASQNYKALEDDAIKRVNIKPPSEAYLDVSVSRVDLNITGGTFYGSRLNGETFDYLKETRVSFAGVETAKATTEDKGLILLINMKPVGEEVSSDNIKQVKIYVQRFDGCRLNYSRESIEDGSAKAVSMDKDISCDSSFGSRNNRWLVFTLLNTGALTSGDWEIVTPFVVYRHSNHPFIPTLWGGCYHTDISTCTGGIEPASKLHEWTVVNVRLTKSD
ncbi:hypothetical protein [Moritella sp. 28]|uniref:hypothetical protein n=1 Tax=Moritella sp. 28 TaxID=2746232 RepID=UPI001BA9D50F|nr:hypothetical protein [Moritella sp. 28]QUM84791.1 hypothetical protein HWV02_09900 [Moritella sp. 28]